MLARFALARLAKAASAGLLGGIAGCDKASERKSTAPHPKSANELFFDTLPRRRALFLTGTIDDTSARSLVGQLLALDLERPGEPITLFIMSAGGKVHSGLGIVDTMRLLSSPVCTVCCGHCESMAAVVLACGAPGRRFALAHSRVMIHQPVTRLTDTKRHADQIILHGQELHKTRETLTQLLAAQTGQPFERISALMDRDCYLSAREALDLGLVDAILESADQLPLSPGGKAAAKQPASSVPAAKEERTRADEDNGDADDRGAA